MGKYQVDFTLSRLAAIAISKELWRHSFLYDMLKECFTTDEDKDPGDDLPFYVAEAVNGFNLPGPAKEELTFVVGMIGQEIWKFYRRLHSTYYGYADIADDGSVFTIGCSSWMKKICWTNHGCINFPESMRSLYMSNILPEYISTWLELCIHCLEDCIIDFWPKLMDLNNQPYFWERQLFHRHNLEFDKIIASYWTKRVEDNLGGTINIVLHPLLEEFCDAASLPAEDMFIYSFVNKKDSVVEYFWELLNDNQRRRVIANICEKIVSDDPSTQEFKDLFFSENGLGVHLLIFFLQQLSSYGHDEIRIKILGSGFALREFLNWPYDHVFLKTLRESLIHHDSIDYEPIITRIFELVCRSKREQLIEDDFRYRRIFYEIWKINPTNLKNSINYSKIMSLSWWRQQIDLLNHILKDEELTERRREFLNEIVELHEFYETDTLFLERFIEKVLVPGEEQKWFRDRISSVKRF